jgi:hypothetical protein
MKEKLAKLIDVKSIVTLLLTIVFCVLCLIGTLPTEFLTIYTVIIGFYFGTQSQKAAQTVKGYTGPQQGYTLPENTEPIYETINTADAQKIHPPDDEATAKVGFEY